VRSISDAARSLELYPLLKAAVLGAVIGVIFDLAVTLSMSPKV
jgi:hypothetical protein